MRYRRQKQQVVFASLLAAIGIVNILFYFILNAPARADYIRLRNSISQLRVEVHTREQQVEHMDKTGTQLARFDQDRKALFTTHFVPRLPGFAMILPRLEEMAQQAGVRTTRKDYSIDDIPQYGLYPVTIKLPIQGSYANVVNFIRELETSDTLFLINSIDVHADDAAPLGTAGTVALTLSLETFFYQ